MPPSPKRFPSRRPPARRQSQSQRPNRLTSSPRCLPRLVRPNDRRLSPSHSRQLPSASNPLSRGSRPPSIASCVRARRASSPIKSALRRLLLDPSRHLPLVRRHLASQHLLLKRLLPRHRLRQHRQIDRRQPSDRQHPTVRQRRAIAPRRRSGPVRTGHFHRRAVRSRRPPAVHFVPHRDARSHRLRAWAVAVPPR